MIDGKSHQTNVSDIFPYDFVKENEVIASLSENGYEVISTTVSYTHLRAHET